MEEQPGLAQLDGDEWGGHSLRLKAAEWNGVHALHLASRMHGSERGALDLGDQLIVGVARDVRHVLNGAYRATGLAHRACKLSG